MARAPIFSRPAPGALQRRPSVSGFRVSGFQVRRGARDTAPGARRRRAARPLDPVDRPGRHAQEAAAIGLATHVVEPTADLATAHVQETATLDRDAVEGILRRTGEDTEDADLASLVRSLARPGLHRRIARSHEGAAVRSGTGRS